MRERRESDGERSGIGKRIVVKGRREIRRGGRVMREGREKERRGIGRKMVVMR